MHPSELGARFDAGRPDGSGIEAPRSSAPASEERSGRESRRALGRRVAISCAALSMAFGAAAAGRFVSVRSTEERRAESAGEARTGGAVKVGEDARGRDGSAANSMTAVQIHQGAQVSTISGICVEGGVVTASDSVSKDGVQITISGDSRDGRGAPATQHPVSVTSIDDVSGLAYLTGYRCAESLLSLEQASRMRSGQALLIAARPQRQTLSTQERAQVFSEGGVLAKTQYGRTGDAILIPILEKGSDQTGSTTDSSAIGAALVNTSGAFMGIVIAEVNGSYLAIPSSMARRVISQFISGEFVEAGWLGLELDIESKVLAVSSGSPAQGAGILVGDQIYAADGERTAGVETLLASIQAHAPGDRLFLTIEHQGRTRELPVMLGSRPRDMAP